MALCGQTVAAKKNLAVYANQKVAAPSLEQEICASLGWGKVNFLHSILICYEQRIDGAEVLFSLLSRAYTAKAVSDIPTATLVKGDTARKGDSRCSKSYSRLHGIILSV